MEKRFWDPGKVLEFFVTKRVGTLFNVESVEKCAVTLQ